MNADDKKLENSLESTMDMSQDDIEKLLLQYEQQGKEEEIIIDDPDLDSLLASLENQDNTAIQDISEMLNKSDQNQAVDEEVMELLKSQEEEGLTAYDAMDLFSAEEVTKKEGFISKLFDKIRKNKKKQKEEIQDWEEIEQQEVDETYLQDNSMNDALAMLTGDMDGDNEPVIPAKSEKKKKNKKKNKKEVNETEDEEIKEKPKKGKGKEKGKKEKKEKKSKKDNNEIREKVKEKPTIADAIMELEAEQDEPPHKNKIIMTFVASILIMLGFLVVNFYFTGHANKRLAEEAYEEQDYLECYQLLYGQKMNDSQRAMYKRSECILKTDIFWRDYHAYMDNEKWLEGLDKLTQYVYQYPKCLEDAKTWNGQEFVENTYYQVQGLLAEEYEASTEQVSQIAELKDDADYTRALLAIVKEKEKREALNKKYPDMLPEEKDRLSQ
ncbi:MAG: hypothetical protein J6L65_01250 [Lachnospiraceae bacterium]|nr:hypothetical protein [Lachnospiraceae bacterium]